MTATGADLVVEALRHLGEPYVFGARVPKDAPTWRGPWDCAEFASWVVFRVAGVLFGVNGSDPATADAYSGRWAMDARRAAATCSLELAASTAGAVLVRAPGAGIGHVAISDGIGGTVEAHSARLGVIRSKIAGRRWSCGVLVPGVAYPPAPSGGLVGATRPPAAAVLRLPEIASARYVRGDQVVAVQRALLRAGFDPGPADGIFGPRTAGAAAKFQRARGLVVDGEVGIETATALGVELEGGIR